ncbi:CCDC90 family protein [Ectothiorhodospira marina]|uniref:CCDC90 family protein n=1 Tax=Ectothiorhodospira marina TaxID=1396821 RepID=UPI001FDF2528|nr:CCDC90 family protein [Ectothiorhodospira marina]
MTASRTVDYPRENRSLIGLKALASVTFDTHEFIKTLEKAGFDEKQAEAVALAFKNAQREAEVATKEDIALVRSEVREMEHRLKADLIKWMAGLLLAQAALVATLVKLLS